MVLDNLLPDQASSYVASAVVSPRARRLCRVSTTMSDETYLTQDRSFSHDQIRQSNVITTGDGWIEDLDGRWRVVSHDTEQQIWHCMRVISSTSTP